MKIKYFTPKYLAPVVLAITSTFAASNANAITVGTYNLSNHLDGSVAPPLYGLRLDGLLTGSTSEEYTFDFDHSDSAMTLTWDGNTIVINGQAFGGEDSGAGYVTGTTAVWDIHFEYTVGVSSTGGEGGLDDVFVHADNANFGTVSSVLGSFELEDQDADSGSGLSFQLGDESGAGHRGFAGISGWGWMNHGANCVVGDCSHIYASDWLFTASPVPVPAAVYLFGAGLLGLVGIARRRVN